MNSKIFVILPTYNEVENLELICKQILLQNNEIEVLVVDDNSPDKTGEKALKLKETEPRMHVMIRKQKKGRGYAGIDGFKEALKYNPDFLLEMDADFSHNPILIPNFISAIQSCDVVIGSRFIANGKDSERSFLRKSISFVAKSFLKFVLDIKIEDPTSGFRMFRSSVIQSILPKLKAGDPFIITEILYYTLKMNFSIKEIPIKFLERKSGVSKLKITTLFKYLLQVIKLRFF